MKLGLCTWSYHRSLASKKLTLEAIIKMCRKDFKLDGIEIIAEELPETGQEYITGLKGMAHDHGLVISSLSCTNNFGVETDGELSKAVDDVMRWIDTAELIGSTILRIFTGWAPKEKQAALWPNIMDGISRSARYARTHKIRLAVEPHNGSGFLSTSAEAVKFIKEAASENVKLNLDTGNYRDDDPYGAIVRSLPYTVHAHAKIRDLSGNGQDSILDYDRILRIFKQNDYKGFLSIEYEGAKDEIECVPKAVKMMRKMLEKHDLVK